ncbi:hypothetical protein B2G71_05185 [Novosphingobium sp. PC22D]|uniref:FAD-dependent oxidoreductase n=1 Tax=Novosphingobium sp. PC22D TaxID=1962403 RepID=UPI000BEF335E|nr:GMC family oxidoreductase [Novosphingobium sp. PC22D]PEQ13715.1 hypothetical protein B2G71_05185 [Novosphingobium sp. PC22D]
MIRDARKAGLPAEINADVAIVGAGAAGIVLALELADAGMKVVVTEAGGDKFSQASQEFYRAQSIDPEGHGQVDMFRRRNLGGSTAAWGGRCIPFDPIDFEDRPWLNKARWPIGHDDVAPHYARALEYLDAGVPEFEAAQALPGEPADLAPGVRSRDVVLDRIERFSHPLDLGKGYRKRLQSDPRITLLLHAPVLCVLAEPGGNAARGVRVARTDQAAPLEILAPTVVVAAGGLETVRILLHSNEERPCGLGNDNDLVGRFYQCHIEGEFGEIAFPKDARDVRMDYQRTATGIYCRRYIWVSPEAQRKHRLAGLVLRPYHPNIVDPGHRSPILSSMYLVKDHIVPEYARKLTSLEEIKRREVGAGSLRFWARHARNIALGGPSLARFTLDFARRRTFAKRKLPSVVLTDPRGIYPLDINAEQEPNFDSRVTLGNELDRNGQRRLRIEWRTTRADNERLVAGLQLVAHAFERSDGTRVKLTREDLDRAMHWKVPVGGHHIGTARMADSPSDGVCDANCEVFGTRGLYLAGASVFSTSGFANPTLTLVALTLRLARTLIERGRPGLAKETVGVLEQAG